MELLRYSGWLLGTEVVAKVLLCGCYVVLGGC